MSSVSIRTALPADLNAVSKLAAELVRYHYALDPKRYLLAENLEQGYERFLLSELSDKRAVVLSAVRGESEIVGYAYGRIEPRNWNELLEKCGKIHDVLVADNARRLGVGAMLVTTMCERLEALGAPRVLLLTAWQNTEGQALFEKLGFRKTMIEMTREKGG